MATETTAATTRPLPGITADAPAVTGPALRRTRPRRRLTTAGRVAMLAITLLPLVIIALKRSPLPFGAALADTLSLAGSPDDVRGRIANVLFVPLGAVLVVFFRVTLGIRVLGPFRAVLLAVAFQATGVPLGLLFLGLVAGVMVAVRPVLRKFGLPYYSRISVSLSMVAVIIMIALVTGRTLHSEALTRAAYFPLVVLCLTAEGFASTLRSEGIRSAVWRITATALVAVLIAGLAAIRGLQRMLTDDPELILVAIGLIVLISEHFGYRFFAFLNPPVKRKGRRRRRRKRPVATPVALTSSPSPSLVAATPALGAEPATRRLAS